MFENVDGRKTDGETDDWAIAILIAHFGAFGSGELKMKVNAVSVSSYKNFECFEINTKQTT